MSSLRRSCELVDAEGCWTLGSLLIESASLDERREARTVLMTGCTKGRPAAPDIFSQRRASTFTEKACQKLRELRSDDDRKP
jgi:hypothetical protein